MSSKHTKQVIDQFSNSEISINFVNGFKATFIRNIRIIWQYKFSLLIGFVNTFTVASLFYYVANLVPNQLISQDNYIVSSIPFIFAGSMLVDISTRILMKSMNSFTSEIKQGTFETLATRPFGLKRYFLSEITFEVFYGLFFSLIYYIPVLLIFPIFQGIEVDVYSVLSFLLLIVFVFLFFFSLSLLAANITILVKRGREISMVIIGIIHLLSGSLFPLSLFPEWLRIIAYFSPMTLAVQAFRLCLFGGGTVGDFSVWMAIILLAVSSLIILLLFNVTYKKIYKRIRTKGTIHEY
ncbi:MAG: ABC transporter permease [Candidatus Heimdallarchaeota archaeon]|nr:ABC transporter permease [Candidatus Heimdallarchaeota archaeon]